MSRYSASYNPPTRVSTTPNFNFSNIGGSGGAGAGAYNTGANLGSLGRSSALGSRLTAAQNLGGAAGSLAASAQLANQGAYTSLSNAYSLGANQSLGSAYGSLSGSAASNARAIAPGISSSNASNAASRTANLKSSLSNLKNAYNTYAPKAGALQSIARGATGEPQSMVDQFLASGGRLSNTTSMLPGAYSQAYATKGALTGNKSVIPGTRSVSSATQAISPYAIGIDSVVNAAQGSTPIGRMIGTINKKAGDKFDSTVQGIVSSVPPVRKLSNYIGDRGQMIDATTGLGYGANTARVNQAFMQTGSAMGDNAQKLQEYGYRASGLSAAERALASNYKKGRSQYQAGVDNFNRAKNQYANARNQYANYIKSQGGDPTTRANLQRIDNAISKQTGISMSGLQSAASNLQASKGQLRGMFGNLKQSGAISARNQANLNAANSRGTDLNQQARMQAFDPTNPGGFFTDVGGIGTLVTGNPALRAGGQMIDKAFDGYNQYKNALANDRDQYGNYNPTLAPKRTKVGRGVDAAGEVIGQGMEDTLMLNPGNMMGDFAKSATILAGGRPSTGTKIGAVPQFLGNVVGMPLRGLYRNTLGRLFDSNPVPKGMAETGGLIGYGQRFFPGGKSGYQEDVTDRRNTMLNNLSPQAKAYYDNPEAFKYNRETQAANVPAPLRGGGQGIRTMPEYISSQGLSPQGMVPGMFLADDGRMYNFQTDDPYAPGYTGGSSMGVGLSGAVTPAMAQQMSQNISMLGMNDNQIANAARNRAAAQGLTPAQFLARKQQEFQNLRGGMKPQFTPQEIAMMQQVDALRGDPRITGQGMRDVPRADVGRARRGGRSIPQYIKEGLLQGTPGDAATNLQDQRAFQAYQRQRQARAAQSTKPTVGAKDRGNVQGTMGPMDFQPYQLSGTAPPGKVIVNGVIQPQPKMTGLGSMAGRELPLPTAGGKNFLPADFDPSVKYGGAGPTVGKRFGKSRRRY